MFIKVNGVWKNVVSTLVKINGHWHETEIYNKIDGTWKDITSNFYTTDQLLGFRIDYQLAPMKDQYYPDLPHLSYRDDLPLKFFIGGENQFDTRIKGASIHYFSHKDYTEGISKWHGKLYMLFNDGREFLISDSENHKHLPNCNVIVNWGAFVDWGATGVKPYGWNSVFNEKQIMIQTPFTTEELIEAIEQGMWELEPPRIILPTEERALEYKEYLEIGLARNTSKPEMNMLGSSGAINQMIRSILVDDISKPFFITIT